MAVVSVSYTLSEGVNDKRDSEIVREMKVAHSFLCDLFFKWISVCVCGCVNELNVLLLGYYQ